MYILHWDEYNLLSWDAMEEYLMGEINNCAVKIWGNTECMECQRVKEYFADQGYDYYDVSTLVSGENPDLEAMTQLTFQDMRLPLVMVDGEWIDPAEIKTKVA